MPSGGSNRIARYLFNNIEEFYIVLGDGLILNQLIVKPRDIELSYNSDFRFPVGFNYNAASNVALFSKTFTSTSNYTASYCALVTMDSSFNVLTILAINPVNLSLTNGATKTVKFSFKTNSI